MKVYLDQDGVLADFDKALEDRSIKVDRHSRLTRGHIPKSEWTKEELEVEDQIQKAMSEEGFFYNLEVMPKAHELWAVAKNPIVLTARPKNEATAKRVEAEKLAWINKHFLDPAYGRFICCLRSEKSFYASTEIGRYTGDPIPNILVDDLPWNCSEWREAGGISIHYKDADQAIEDLSNYVTD